MRRGAATARTARLRAGLAALAVALLALGGCGHHELAGDRIAGHTLTIYTSLPLVGPSAAGARTVLDGERLALARARGRIGDYAVRLRWLDDATLHQRGWDPGQTTLNARLAVQDPTTIGYIGEFDSGASAIAIPLLNRAGILEISPTSTAVGLTSAGPGAAPGEPGKYYPTGRRTFVAVSPDDARQAAVAVQLQRSLGCRAMFVFNDGGFDGLDAAGSYQLVARAAGLTVAGSDSYDPLAQDYRSLALAVARSRADCVVISALPESNVVLLVTQTAAAVPRARFFVTAALAQPGFLDPAHGGIPPRLDRRVVVVAPAPLTGGSHDGVLIAYRRQFGAPGPYTVYGYVSMRLLLDAIARASDGGRDAVRRSKVRAAVFASGGLDGIHVSPDGTTNLRRVAVYIVAGGRLKLWYQTAAPR